MERDQSKDMDAVLSSTWPQVDQDILEEVSIKKEPNIVDFQRLMELTNCSDKGNAELAKLVKNWEYKHANGVRLLKEELDQLSEKQQEAQLKKLEILEGGRFEKDGYGGDECPIPVGIDVDYDSVAYWKQRSLHMEKLLDESLHRERILVEKLQGSIGNLEKKSAPMDELSQILVREDNFLRFVLQNAPVTLGHQDKEMRYRFIFNHFPGLGEQDIIGKTDVEIFTGAGVEQSHDFKKEVLERGSPAKREITFATELFGSKTFLVYAEPVFSKAGEAIGVNYLSMDISDQVRKREKMAKLREEIAVQKANETELNKTIHITEETMLLKQMLLTLSHMIRSPLSRLVSVTEMLSTTNLNNEQMQLLNVMLSSGDSLLQLIDDVLDITKVISGAMKFDTTKFRPREVVKHVIQKAAASVQKLLTLQGHVVEDVPIEVNGDAISIRQILTTLVSNAIKYTHEGKVGINMYVIPEPSNIIEQVNSQDASTVSSNTSKDLAIYTNEEQVVWIRCDVYDTGIGIPEHAIPTLFKKYMQAEYGGTGLGLAICKQLVERMGGHLTVSSVEHQGSTFTFILPCKVSSTSDSDDQQEEHDVVGDDGNDNDDVHSGVFVFQPRTSGALFPTEDHSL